MRTHGGLLIFALVVLVFFGWFLSHLSGSLVEKAPAQQDTVLFGDVPIHLETVSTPKELALGLGGRTEVPDHYGMLFVFGTSDKYGFWMKDMNVPIDIFWLDDKGRVVTIASNVATSTYPDVFYPTEPARYVLETKAGFAKLYDIATGTSLQL